MDLLLMYTISLKPFSPLHRKGSNQSFCLLSHSTFQDSTIRLGDLKKAQLATPEWNLNAHLFSLDDSLARQVLARPS